MPDGQVHRRRKLHAFETPCSTRRAAILICWDNNLVKNVRISALLGADILIAPHQTRGCASRSRHAMGLIDPVLSRRRAEDPAAIEAEFRGRRGRNG